MTGSSQRPILWQPSTGFAAALGHELGAAASWRMVFCPSPGILFERAWKIFPSLPGSRPKAAKSRRSAGPRYRRAGETVIYLLVIRPEFRAALARLKALGIWAMMLTGHATAVARWVARKLALDEFFAEALPD